MPIKSDSPRSQQIGATPYVWEADALTYLREGLDDSEPTRVWTLFEFVSKEGNLNEVDALVLTAKGFFLVEIKSHPCTFTGDNGTWTLRWPDGRTSSEALEARHFDERLERASTVGSFLVLGVPRQNHERALTELLARFSPTTVSVEHLLMQRLRAEADQVGVRWQKVLDADAADRNSPDWKNLVLLAKRAAQGLADAITTKSRPALVTRLGVLHRYGLLTEFVERLRERTARQPGREGSLHGAWLLIATNCDGGRPMLDGEPVPVIDNTGWAEVPRAWIQGAHREQAS